MLYRKNQPSLLSRPGQERVRATLIFAPAKKHKWLNKILKPGFAHVRCIIHLQDCDVMVDPRISYTSIDVYPKMGRVIPDDDETVLFVDRFVNVYKMRRIAGPLNCVETIKGFLGISNPFVLTPYQLYKRVKHG